MKKVVKFGGSSLASADQFMKVCDIIRADESRRYVVPSAPGKRFNDDIKVTDMLYRCYELAESGQPFNKQMNQIKDRYNEIIRGLKLDFSLNDDFETIKKQFLAKAGRMYAASRGEYLNGKIMAKYLGFEFIDSANVIVLTKTAILMLIQQTNFFLSVWQLMTMQLSLVFTGLWPTEPLLLFPVVVPTLPVLW